MRRTTSGDKGMRMQTPTERATAYLDKLETDRQAAISMSEQKAEEAKLIRARQEGFQAAMEIFASAICITRPDLQTNESPGRRRRRDISQLIRRELTFSGKAMSTAQIAKAIEYTRERTETALRRLEQAGGVAPDGPGRWTVGIAGEANAHGSPTRANSNLSSATAEFAASAG